MNRRLLCLTLLAAAGFGPGAASFAQVQAHPDALSSSFVESQAAADKQREEEEVYSSGQDALGEGEYDDAVKAFDSVIRMRGRKADAAMYWKAYALNKAGNKTQAQATLNDLRKSYPQSRWLRDARVLEGETKPGGNVDVFGCDDEETKILALNALMNSDPERAVPILDKVIHGNCSPKMKDKALFVLAQSNSDKAQQILLSLAKANNEPDLQTRAIRYIGMNGNSRNRAILREIYTNSTDPNVKKAVFKGWLMCGGKEDVLAVARTEKSPDLRREAIRYLGLMGGRSELRDMYKSSADADTRDAVVHAMLLCGDSEGLAEIANTEKDPKVLGSAIKTLGLVGGHDSLNALTTIYNSHSDIETKKLVINSLFLHNAGKEMVAMARKETNPELKRELISKMSLMRSPEITEYMMEILNK
jgi:tetratricopeptide (TPR) repeat protein